MAKKNWWEYSVQDILHKKREIYLFEPINNKISQDIIIEMQSMAEVNPKKPIWFYLNSVGGYVPAGLAIIDVMEKISLQTPIYTVAVGEVCSMASLIFVCGTKRFISENSYFMGHPMSFGTQDYSSFVRDRVNYCAELEERLMNIYKKRTKLTKKDLEKIKTGELWLNARQCIKKGIADEIW